jgi:two-component system capsular synthesis sensor histidine kinase RcsC
VDSTPELHQIKDLEEKIRKLSENLAHTTTDPDFQHRLNTHLLALVEQRAQEAERYNRLLQENLHEVKQRRERTATTVHDLKIPITICLLNLDLAESEEEARIRALHFVAMRRELEFMLDTVANLLDLERDGQPPHGQITPVHLHELAGQTLARMQILIKDKKGLRLINTVPADLPPVRCDPHRMARVLSNILSNAIKYTEAGAIEISGRQSTDEESPNRVRLTIRDTGSGIDPARRDTLFQLFSGDESRYDSTGVGLVYVKRTIESYGGRVFIDSKKGEGTLVTLDLPGARGV